MTNIDKPAISKTDVLQQIVGKLKLFQTSPELYGGRSGLIEYGPYGATIKSNLVNRLRRSVRCMGFWEVESPVISPDVVWEASGHAERFVDIVGDSDGRVYRIDKLIEESFPNLRPTDFSLQGLADFCKLHSLCPPGNKEVIHNVREYNLMVTSALAGKPVVLRPETATMSYLLFRECFEAMRRKMPLHIFQVGKAFRNEVTCRQGLIRAREFEQFECQIFTHEENLNSFEGFASVSDLQMNFLSAAAQLSNGEATSMSIADALNRGLLQHQAYAFCFGVVEGVIRALALPKDLVRLRQHTSTEMAHYAKDAWDVEFHTDQYGWLEICGVHDRGTYDLERHATYSKKSQTVPNSSNEQELPRILEIAFGVGRVMYALLENAISTRDEKNVLALPPGIAPYDVAVLPLVKKATLPQIANDLVTLLRNSGYIVCYDATGSIGKRYARMDELGTPKCITIDFESETEKTVTFRDRDTGEQERVSLSQVVSLLAAPR